VEINSRVGLLIYCLCKKTSEIGSVLFLYVLVKGVTVLPKDFQAKTVVRKKLLTARNETDTLALTHRTRVHVIDPTISLMNGF